MAKAIFHRDFNYSSRKRNVGWAVKASPHPQSFPHELIDAAIARGAATLVPPRRAKPADEPDQQPERRLHLQQPSSDGSTEEN